MDRTVIPDQSISEEMIDATLADSFPASDPPSWTLGRDREYRQEPRQRAPYLDGKTGETAKKGGDCAEAQYRSFG
jgi:hypothetical protein